MNGKKEESKDEETRKGSVNSFTRVPKLPNFNPDLDDLPAYISRFETAAPTFQRAMNKVLGHLKFVTNYFDDVLIFSETWSEHLKHIKNLTNIGKS